ncbi:retrovirus-related pol polyprotein from transposon TNT 1-94 [Tanacetum coccineum]
MSGNNGEKLTQKTAVMGDNNGENLLQTKTISPYDITANDNPGSLITQVQLKGETYDEWACSLRTALSARKKFGFVNGTIKQPNEKSLDLEDWWTNNSLIVSWIMNIIESLLRSTTSHIEVAEDLSKDIKERFSMANGPRIHQLKAKLANGFAFAKRRKDEKVHQFLMRLDETLYGAVRSNLLAQDPLPTLNKIYSTLVQEEHVKTVVSAKEECGEVMIFVVNTATRSGGRNVSVGQDKHQDKHKYRRGGRLKANAVQSSTSGAPRNDVISIMDRVEVIGLNNDQWETLKNILNAAKIGANENLIGWRVFDLESHTFLVSRDVVFYEDEFPYLKHNTGTTSHETNDHIRGSMKDWCDLDNDGNEVRHSVNHEEEQYVDQVFNCETNDSINEEAQNADPVNSVLREGSSDTQNEECLGRGHRNKVPSTRLKTLLVAALKQYGFHQSTSDYSLFTLQRDKVHLNVLVYVDDLIISGNDEAGLLGAKPTDLPLEQNHQLPLANGKPLVDPEPYRRLVGSLIYLSVTRPDLSYCVHMLAQFMQSPLQEHWDATLRVVRYLKGSPGQGILLRVACDLQLHGWWDSDWAACPITRRSLTVWFIQLGDTLISWKTKSNIRCLDLRPKQNIDLWLQPHVS